MWGPGSCPCLSPSALCCPAGMWGLGVWSQACGGPFQLGLGSQPLLCPVTAGPPPLPCGLAGQRLGCPPRRLPCGRLWGWPGGRGQPGRPGEPLGALGRLLLPHARCGRPPPRSRFCLCPLACSLAALPLLQTWPAGAAMASWATGPVCATGSCSMCWPPLPTSPPSMGYPGAGARRGRGPHGGNPPTTLSHHLQMLLGYANATPRGLEFLDFLDDEHTYKTLFVPVNEGFVDNMVTWSVGRAGPGSAFCGWSTTTAVLCP